MTTFEHVAALVLSAFILAALLVAAEQGRLATSLAALAVGGLLGLATSRGRR